MIRFVCEQCGRGLAVADTHAGRKGKCPHCRHVVHVPQPAPPLGESPSVSGAASATLSQRDHAFLDLSPRTPPARDDAGAAASTAEAVTGIAYVEDAPVETPAGPADVLLYPTSADGLIHMGILVLGLLAIGLFRAFIARLLGPYAGILVLILQIIILGYMVFYLSYCIFDSSRGGRRAPSVALGPAPDRGEVLSQMLLLLASTAICFWPAAVYYGVTGRVDAWCALLAAFCAFFWPMALLAAVLFDAIDALNPLLIVRSIIATLPGYLALILELGVLAVLVIVVRLVSVRLPIPQVLWTPVFLYLLLMGTHLLGRHYWRHKGRLDWGL